MESFSDRAICNGFAIFGIHPFDEAVEQRIVIHELSGIDVVGDIRSVDISESLGILRAHRRVIFGPIHVIIVVGVVLKTIICPEPEKSIDCVFNVLDIAQVLLSTTVWG